MVEEGFVEAGELEIGDEVETADGERLFVTDIRNEYLDVPVTVYNFEVADWHTYYVSDEDVLVHNVCHINYGNSNLKFGDNDLVYGPSAGGKLVELQKSAGGKLLSDVGNPYDMGYGSDWLRFSTDTIENTVKQGNYIHFDLTNMQDIDGILNGTSPYMNKITSGELIYIRDNWDRLSGNIKFYNNGEEVMAPWMN